MTWPTDVVFVDWLDFTLPLEGCHLPSFRELLESVGFSGSAEDGRWTYRIAGKPGVAVLGPTRGVDRVSLSGQVLSLLRADGAAWLDLIAWLSERPHRITRLDVALDRSVSGPDEVARFRRKAGRSGGKLALGQRPTAVSWVLGRDLRGSETGTMYIGRRGKNQVLARVYDKRHELEGQGFGIDCVLTRYEIEVRGSTGKSRNPCLNDVFAPASLFWEFAAPVLLPRPAGVPPWLPEAFQSFSVPKPQADPLSRVWRLIEASGFFASLVSASAGLEDRDAALERIVQFSLRRSLRLDREGRKGAFLVDASKPPIQSPLGSTPPAEPGVSGD